MVHHPVHVDKKRFFEAIASSFHDAIESVWDRHLDATHRSIRVAYRICATPTNVSSRFPILFARYFDHPIAMSTECTHGKWTPTPVHTK